MLFEVKDRDTLARICKMEVNGRRTLTPNIAIVVNPNRMLVTPKEIERAGFDILITNAFIIKQSPHYEKIKQEGLHKFFDWNGIVYTDSGTFQMYSRGKVEITNEETVRIQKELGSDLITPLDLFVLPYELKSSAERKTMESIARARAVRDQVKNLVGPVQGGLHLDLRARAARELGFADVLAVGGLVPLFENYEFAKVVDILLAVKKERLEKPVHAFGAGHPMVIPLLSLLGVDLMDSASYALYAQEGRYMLPNGTVRIEELEELPCNCDVCKHYTPKELGVKEIAIHNLNMIAQELKAVRSAIRRKKIWEYTEMRCKAHPELWKAFQRLKEYQEFLADFEPLSRKSFFFLGNKIRPIFKFVERRTAQVQAEKKFDWLGLQIPAGLQYTYPFAQTVGFEIQPQYVDDYEIVKSLLQYQYGKEASKLIEGKQVKVYRSESGMPRKVLVDGKPFATIREDGILCLRCEYAEELLKHANTKVRIQDGLREYITSSIFAKFVIEAKCNPGDQVVVYDSEGAIGIGKAILNGKEMLSFNRGVAVKLRCKTY